MDEIIEMAEKGGFCNDINNGIYLCAPRHIEHFAELVAKKERERISSLIAKMPGDTAASIAIWVREQ